MLMAIAVKSAPGRNRQTYEPTAQSRLGISRPSELRK